MPRGAASRSATFNAAADAFSRGWAVGANAKRQKKDDERADKRLQLDQNQDRREQGRYDREMQEDELDKAVREKKRQKLAADIDLDMEMRRDEMKRMTEAEEAFGKFTGGADLIDWGTPDAPTQYEALTRQYLPGILKHESVAKKWEALDGANQKSRIYSANKIMEQGLATALEEAAKVAPDVLLAPPTRPDGKPDFEAIRNVVRERQKEIDDQAIELRKVGRAPQKATLSEGQKLKMGIIKEQITEIDKQVTALMSAKAKGEPGFLPVNDPAYMQLRARRANLMRDLEAMDALLQNQESPGSSAAPEEAQIENPTGQTQRGDSRQFRQFRSGRFKVSVEE